MVIKYTQDQYDKAVSKYGKSKVDAAIRKEGAIKKSSASIKDKAIDTAKDLAIKGGAAIAGSIPSAIASAATSSSGKKIIGQTISKAEAAAKAAAAKRRRKIRKYKKQLKKYGSGENMVKIIQDKYGVNSPEARKARSYVKSRSVLAGIPLKDIKTRQTEEKIDKKIDTKKGLTKAQYTNLVGKYGGVDKVQAAVVSKFGENSPEAKKMKELLNQYSGGALPTQKIRENISTITDARKKAEAGDFEGLAPETEETVFAKNWRERIPTAEKFGIENYTGTAEQNIELRKKLRESAKGEELKQDIEKQEPEKTEDLTDETPNTNEELARVREQNREKERKERGVEALKQLRLQGRTDEDMLTEVAEKYGADSEQYKKAETFLKENPETDSTEGIDKTLLEDSEEVLRQKQIDALMAQRDENISNTAEDFIKGAEIIAQNNEALQEFYKEMATDLRNFIETSRQTKLAALERTKTTQLNRVVGQIRAMLARRGVDISNIAPEQLIAMSGELGSSALEAINEATTAMENEMIDLTNRKTAEINKYLEDGLIKQGEADASIEQMRQLKEKMISDIKQNYITNVFKITSANIADQDKTKAEVMNTVSTFVSQLGLSGTAQGIMENYINAQNSIEALETMIGDLNDPNSELYKAVASVEKANQLAAEFQGKLDLMKATKSSSSGSSTPKSELSSAQKQTLVSQGYNPNDYPTFAALINLAKQDKNLDLALKKSAIDVQSFGN